MHTRAKLFVFDMIETVFSLEPVRARMVDAGLSSSALEVWFARLLRDAFAITAAGGYAPFSDVAQASLATVAHSMGIDDLDTNAIMQTLQSLPAHDDARQALQECADAGVPVVALTNGTRETTEQLLDVSGLAPLVRRVVSVADIGVWKPAAAAYRGVLDAGMEPRDAALVAVHGWDIYGARQAGLSTGWCSRLEGVLSPALGPADVEEDDLESVVRSLLRSDSEPA